MESDYTQSFSKLTLDDLDGPYTPSISVYRLDNVLADVSPSISLTDGVIEINIPSDSYDGARPFGAYYYRIKLTSNSGVVSYPFEGAIHFIVSITRL